MSAPDYALQYQSKITLAFYGASTDVGMDILIGSRHPHRLEIADTSRRRRWSDAAKLRVVEESFSEPRMSLQVQEVLRRDPLSGHRHPPMAASR